MNNWKSRDKPPSPKYPGASPTPPCPREEPIQLTLFAELFFFIIPWCAALEGDWGGGSERASSWGECGWEIQRVPPLTPSLSSPFVDYRSSLVTLRPARLCNTSLAIQTQHPPPPTGTTTTITELSWACTELAWAPELHL